MNSSQQDMTMVWLSGVIILILLLAFSYSTYSTCFCSQQSVEQNVDKSDFKTLTETLFTAPVPVATPMPFVVQSSELVVPSIGGVVIQGGTNNYIRVAGTATTDATRNTVGTSNNQIQIYNAGNLTAAFDVDGLYVRALTATGNSILGGTLGVTGNTTVGGTLGVTGNSVVGGALDVSGNTTLRGTLGVTGNITVNTFKLAGANSSLTFGNGSLTSGACVSMGDGALSNSTGTNSTANTAIGYFASNNNTTGTQNTSIGYIAGRDVTTGSYNTCVGSNAGYRVTTGNNNTYVGMQAGPFYDPSTGSNNTSIGYLSGAHLTTGTSNTCIGYVSGANMTTGLSNTCIGTQAGNSITTGQYNTALGERALGGGTIGVYNTSIGHLTHVGMTTGSNNIALGALAGYNITTGEYNIHIGRDVNASSPSVSDEIVIGRNIVGKGANTCYIGSATTHLNNVNVSGTLKATGSGTFAWGYFTVSSTTATLVKGFNVSSMTMPATTYGFVNFTNPATDSSYCVVANATHSNGATPVSANGYSLTTTQFTTQFIYSGSPIGISAFSFVVYAY